MIFSFKKSFDFPVHICDCAGQEVRHPEQKTAAVGWYKHHYVGWNCRAIHYQTDYIEQGDCCNATGKSHQKQHQTKNCFRILFHGKAGLLGVAWANLDEAKASLAEENLFGVEVGEGVDCAANNSHCTDDRGHQYQ
jgi:hypothetical protein